MYLIKFFLVLFGLSTGITCGFSQDLSILDKIESEDSTIYKITTMDVNDFLGTINSVTQDYIEVKTNLLGLIKIPISTIKSIEEVEIESIIDGELWFKNPQSTRYFFSPNAYGPSGESYYQNVWVLFNQVVFGVSDNFTIGAGIVPLFFFAGASSPVWITPRLSIPIEKERVGLAAGGLFGTVMGEEQSGFGILYGITTFGNRDSNVSIGLGYGYAGGDFADAPTISFSGMWRTGPRGYFMTENYYIGSAGDDVILMSAGGRRIIGKVGLDFGGFLPISEIGQGFIVIPWLGITIPFTKRDSR